MGDLINNPISFVFSLAAIVIAISIHEFSHAWTADRLGDPTPSLQGRLTLDPRAHLDLWGTIFLIIFHFGWGKPVQFDPFNLRNPKRDAALISLAGPASNILLASASALLLQLVAHMLGGIAGSLIATFLVQLVFTNVVLAVFNLLPVHPLDGFKIVGGLLPDEYAKQWYELQSYGYIFLLMLILPLFRGGSLSSQIITPVINFLLHIFLPQSPIV